MIPPEVAKFLYKYYPQLLRITYSQVLYDRKLAESIWENDPEIRTERWSFDDESIIRRVEYSLRLKAKTGEDDPTLQWDLGMIVRYGYAAVYYDANGQPVQVKNQGEKRKE